MEKLLLVAIGGAIGAVLRFLAVPLAGRLGGDLAWGTMFVNVAGSFVMGVLAVALLARMPDSLGRVAPFAMTGVLGAFTTFSAFSLDAFRLFEEGRVAAAIGYVGGSVMLSVAALVAGVLVMRSLL